MSGMSDALLEDRNGVLIAIEVTTGAKHALFPAGYNEWREAIGCRVVAQAVGGKANKAVIGLISATAGVPVSSVSIVTGITSSQKKVRISGISKDRLLDIFSSQKNAEPD